MSSQHVAGAETAAIPRLLIREGLRERLALLSVLLLSVVLNVVGLSRIGLGNTYYAAAVKSMMQSWHNFFFVSFDPGGFVTIDKPPLAFWLQTASAKVFGFNGVSLLLPEVIAGVLSVWLLYALVARVSGREAGLLAALALAVTPVVVLVDRSNLVESILVLTLLLAAWAVFRAVEEGKLRWMILAAVSLGLGFNVKSLEAYLAAPAVFLFYAVGVRARWYDRFWHLLVAGIVMLGVSLSWVTAVDLTPASQRPYVASSGTNSELSLALGYNGLGRLTGNTFSFLSGGATLSSTLSELSPTSLGFSRGETGSPGIQRLINAQLGSQIGWLLLLSVVGVVVVAWQRRPPWPLDLAQGSVVLWGGWLATGVAFFSIAGFFHAYYLSTLAPPIAALFGMAIVTLWRDYRKPGFRGWALPLSLVATALLQAHILSYFPAWSSWLTPLVVGATVLLALILGVARLSIVSGRLVGPAAQVSRLLLLALATIVLLLTPFIWSEYTVAHAAPGAVPRAGPAGAGGFGGGFGPPGGRFGGFRERFGGEFPSFRGGTHFSRGGGFDRGTSASPALIRYLQSHEGNARFLVATLNAAAAEPFILATGRPVMDLGGFMGGDHILNASQFASLVARGTVRYVLMGGRGPGGFGPGHFGGFRREGFDPGNRFGGAPGDAFGRNNVNADLTQWVSANCRAVPISAYSNSAISTAIQVTEAQPLYDCSAYATPHGRE